MRREDIAFTDLSPNPDQPRKTFTRIEELAETIRTYGLLENLVVREDPATFTIIAGERRYRAIGLLISQGEWTGPVPCLVVDSDGTFEAIIENIAREPVPPWQLGHRFQELREAGLTMLEIGERVGKNKGYVSLYCQIAEGLAPKTVATLDKLGAKGVTRNQCLRLAKLVDPVTLEPQEEQQMKALERMLLQLKQPRRRSRASGLPLEKRIMIRFQRLKRGMIVPAHAMPYVDAVIRYLDGRDTRLKFGEFIP